MHDALPLPAAEYELRWKTFRNRLQELEIDCAVILSPESQYWLTGYDTFLGAVLPQALIFPSSDRAPTLVVWDADVAIAHQTSIIRDIQTYRFGIDEPAGLFARLAVEKSKSPRRIGADLSSHSLPYAFGKELISELSGVAVSDISVDLGRLRMVKTPEELALMRMAGQYGRLGLAAARAHAQAGLTEIELAAEIEYAMRRAGCDYLSIPTEIASGPRSSQGHGTPTKRRLEAGDLLHIEIGGVERRYNAVSIQSFVVPGAPPKPAARELYDLALKCLRRGLNELRPGVPAAAVEAPALEVIRQAGWGDNFKMRFGYGVGIGYPPTWLEPLKITRTSDEVLVPGTTFVLHACLLDEDANAGVLVGGTYAITADGYELLSGAGDVELV